MELNYNILYSRKFSISENFLDFHRLTHFRNNKKTNLGGN